MKATLPTPSKAAKIVSRVDFFWPMPEDTHLNLAEAMQGGRAVANNLYGAMVDDGLSLKDGACALVCALGDTLAGSLPFAHENGDVADLEMQRNILREKLEPIGIVFALLDRERKALWVHCRGFEGSERNNRILASVQAKWQSDFGKRDLNSLN
jgi:hypothetical protein